MTNQNMWITRPPTVDSWTIRVRELSKDPVYVAEMYLEVRCERKRRPLFTYVEFVDQDQGGYGVVDRCHHWALVMDQDRPINVTQFEQGMCGGHRQEPLF